MPKATTRVGESRQQAEADPDAREIVSGRYPEIRATPTAGCDVCAALADEWFANGDRDVLIEINNHPHKEPKLSRVKAWMTEGAKAE